MKKTLLTLFALLIVVSLVMSACAPKIEEPVAEEPVAEEPAADMAAPAPAGDELAAAYAGEYDGKVDSAAKRVVHPPQKADSLI
ncbi:MAG: hypothetical protein HOG15_08515, partial [Anaerolineae bacterium]|jgi:hypothetical protein|nr:hypothetical protein [Anaerolineae bacterium]MBT4840865.1 hypothetical protein [Anaerolineae bacterium]